jgi:hypothetical protein
MYKTAKLLSSQAKKLVRQIGFGHMLRKMPQRIPTRMLPAWLMSKAEVKDNPNRITLNIGDASLHLTPYDVHLILGIVKGCGTSKKLPRGGGFDKMFNILKIIVDNWSDKAEEEDEQDDDDDDDMDKQDQKKPNKK